MIKSIKICSFVLIFCCIGYLFVFDFFEVRDKEVQNRIIDNVFSVDVSDDVDNVQEDYLGYIYIPRFDVKRLIKDGTDLDLLDSLYVGVYYKSGFLYGDDLIILAGHNVRNVFSCLHKIDIGDFVYIGGRDFYRKFVVYDKLVVDEYNNDFFFSRDNELLLITCDKKGFRLLVFLREVL